MSALLALAPVRSWDLQEVVVAIIVLAAVFGVVYVALQYFGVPFPPLLLKIIGIVLVAVVAIAAIRFLFAQ